jgi:hypothetical protein
MIVLQRLPLCWRDPFSWNAPLCFVLSLLLVRPLLVLPAHIIMSYTLEWLICIYLRSMGVCCSSPTLLFGMQALRALQYARNAHRSVWDERFHLWAPHKVWYAWFWHNTLMFVSDK